MPVAAAAGQAGLPEGAGGYVRRHFAPRASPGRTPALLSRRQPAARYTKASAWTVGARAQGRHFDAPRDAGGHGGGERIGAAVRLNSAHGLSFRVQGCLIVSPLVCFGLATGSSILWSLLSVRPSVVGCFPYARRYPKIDRSSRPEAGGGRPARARGKATAHGCCWSKRIPSPIDVPPSGHWWDATGRNPWESSSGTRQQ